MNATSKASKLRWSSDSVDALNSQRQGEPNMYVDQIDTPPAPPPLSLPPLALPAPDGSEQV